MSDNIPAISPALLDQLDELAQSMAKGTARLLGEAFGGRRSVVDTKSSGTDMVSEVDREAEAYVVAALDEARPHDAILGEEGASREGTTGVRWVVDPLDGTTNFLFGVPAYSVSLAAQWYGQTVVGVVVDPSRGDTWRAAQGRGAFRNDIACTVAEGRSDLATALLATGFSYDADRRRWQAAILAQIIDRIRDVRRFGSAALDLCCVAGGQVDGYFEWGLKEWDLAAGQIICEEAGARVSILPGGTVLATTGALHDDVARLLAGAGEAEPPTPR